MSQMKEVYQERRRIVEIINDILETTWTSHEFKHGKEIDVPPSWRIHMPYLVRRYKENAWIITRNIIISSASPRARRDYLTFLNPLFLKTPREIRMVSFN